MTLIPAPVPWPCWQDAVISTLTLVELPGTEKLSEDRTELVVTEGTLANRSITQMGELVRALARRRGAEHVAWRGGKLTRLLGPLIGANARVHGIATLRAGEPARSLTTLQLASQLRDVVCYPVVNGGAGVPTRRWRRWRRRRQRRPNSQRRTHPWLRATPLSL